MVPMVKFKLQSGSTNVIYTLYRYFEFSAMWQLNIPVRLLFVGTSTPELPLMVTILPPISPGTISQWDSNFFFFSFDFHPQIPLPIPRKRSRLKENFLKKSGGLRHKDGIIFMSK